jgi:two-component system, response regulator YesN
MAQRVLIRPTVLVVGDQVDVSELLLHMVRFTASTYESLTTEDAQQALDLLTEYPVVLAFVHVGLQDMAGLPLATTIKTRFPTTRVILFSAMDEGDLKRHAEVLKLDGYLTKPFTMANVAQLVTTFLP